MNLGPRQTAWVEALESGDFEQTKEFLCKDNKYCCLGVACEVALKLGLPLEVDFPGCKRFSGCSSTLPFTVEQFFGFNSAGGFLHGRTTIANKVAGYLAEANDQGISFKDIASFVREHPEEVFKEVL